MPKIVCDDCKLTVTLKLAYTGRIYNYCICKYFKIGFHKWYNTNDDWREIIKIYIINFLKTNQNYNYVYKK
jgi:hypothetical protein